jgi:hypothetical protein
MNVLQAQGPIVVSVSDKTEPARDISIDVVLGMFATAGWFLLAGAIGCALVAACVILYKRWRDASAPAIQAEHSHTTLRI